jgi:uncharacterized protein
VRRRIRSSFVVFDREHFIMSNRVYRLLERHQRLDDLLRRAQTSRFTDPFEIMRIKKLKLAIRDRLAMLSGVRSTSR